MDIRADYLPFGRPSFSDEEIAAVTRVMRGGWIGMGPEVAAFENELAQFVSAPETVAVSSCTAALHLTMHALGVGAEDEVVCPSFTWCSSANAAIYLGAKVIFSDIASDTCCSSWETISTCLSERTKVIVVVHYGGLAVDVQELRDRLPSHVAIVEDAAHALGARYPDGKPVGSAGNPTCFSFYANKNLSTAEGGAIACHDDQFATRLRTLRQHGQPADAWKRFTHRHTLLGAPLDEIGYKANYTDLQAAIGRVQLRRFAGFQETRSLIADYYTRRIEAMPVAVKCQSGVTSAAHAKHLYTIQIPTEALPVSRDEFVRRLRSRNIGAALHYAPLHLMPCYQRLGGCDSLPITEEVAARILTLPFSASMTVDDAAYVCDHLDECLQEAS